MLERAPQRRKRSHWIWFVFPQLQRLGRSPTAIRYGISSLDEARPTSPTTCWARGCGNVRGWSPAIDGRSAEEIFGWPDNLKVRSSMTLFARATDDNADFRAVLDKFYDGVEDPRSPVEQLTAR